MPDGYRILLSKRVAKDLQSISDHIAKDSERNAAGMIERILVAIESLKVFPNRNVIDGQHPKLRHPVRSLPVQSYMVFFRVIDEHRIVRILRVRHGAMRRLKWYD